MKEHEAHIRSSTQMIVKRVELFMFVAFPHELC